MKTPNRSDVVVVGAGRVIIIGDDVDPAVCGGYHVVISVVRSGGRGRSTGNAICKFNVVLLRTGERVEDCVWRQENIMRKQSTNGRTGEGYRMNDYDMSSQDFLNITRKTHIWIEGPVQASCVTCDHERTEIVRPEIDGITEAIHIDTISTTESKRSRVVTDWGIVVTDFGSC